MKMLSWIPEPYQLMARLALAAVLLAGAATAGAVVNGWRLDGAHQHALADKDKTIAQKDREYGELEAKVSDQNHQIEALQARSTAADDRRKVAEQFAADTLKRIGTREEVVANSKAIDCAGVLKEAWGAWK
jgi:septal ring factor EnvC (AmiA/AmiB activator)